MQKKALVLHQATLARIALSRAIFSKVIFSSVAVLFLVSCASPNLYKNFKPTQEYFRRQWTYSVEPVSSRLQMTGMEYIAPKMDGNTILFGSQRDGLFALYPNLIRERWRAFEKVGIVSPLTLHEGRVFFTSGNGALNSVFLENGKVEWSYELRNSVTSAPTVEGQDLYVMTSDDVLLALESKTGKWLWHYRRKNTTGPVIHGAASPLAIGNVVWAGFSDGTLVALNRKDGKVIWEKLLNNNRRFSGLVSDFCKEGERVYVSAYDNDLYALDAKTGATLWILPQAGGAKGVQFMDGTLYVPSSSGHVYAVDATKGQTKWKFELDSVTTSGVTVLQNYVVVASSAEYLYLLDRTTGKLLDRIDMGYKSGFSGPFVADPSRPWIYGLSRGGNLVALSIEAKPFR